MKLFEKSLPFVLPVALALAAPGCAAEDDAAPSLDATAVVAPLNDEETALLAGLGLGPGDVELSDVPEGDDESDTDEEDLAAEIADFEGTAEEATDVELGEDESLSEETEDEVEADAFVDEGDDDETGITTQAVTLGRGARCQGTKLNCKMPLRKVRASCPAKYKRFDDFWNGRNILKSVRKGSAFGHKIGKVEPRRFLTPGGSWFWPIRGAVTAVDGVGRPLGVIDRKSVKINYGQRKMIAGKAHVLVFSAFIRTSGTDYAGVRAAYAETDRKNGFTGSGWVPESAIHSAIRCMPTLRKPARAVHGAAVRVKNGKDFCNGAYTQTRPECLGSYAGKKVGQRITTSSGDAADYLLNNGGVHNVAWSTPRAGGAASDVLFGSPETALKLVSSERGKVPVLRLGLFRKGSTTRAGSLLFAYVRVSSSVGPDIFGWFTVPSIARSSAPTDVQSNATCAGKARGKNFCDDDGQPFFCNSAGFLARPMVCEGKSRCTTDPKTGEAAGNASGGICVAP